MSVLTNPGLLQEDGMTFMTATQLSDHLRRTYGIIRHASLIKPSGKQRDLIGEKEE